MRNIIISIAVAIFSLSTTACGKSETELKNECLMSQDRAVLGNYPGGPKQFHLDAKNGKFGRWCKARIEHQEEADAAEKKRFLKQLEENKKRTSPWDLLPTTQEPKQKK